MFCVVVASNPRHDASPVASILAVTVICLVYPLYDYLAILDTTFLRPASLSTIGKWSLIPGGAQSEPC